MSDEVGSDYWRALAGSSELRDDPPAGQDDDEWLAGFLRPDSYRAYRVGPEKSGHWVPWETRAWVGELIGEVERAVGATDVDGQGRDREP